MHDCKTYHHESSKVSSQSVTKIQESEFKKLDIWKKTEIQKISDCSKAIARENSKWIKILHKRNQDLAQKMKKLNDFKPSQTTQNGQVPHWKVQLDKERHHHSQ